MDAKNLEELVKDYLSKIEKQPDGCAKWIGVKNRKGYGTYQFNGIDYGPADRFGWELFIDAPMPSKGMSPWKSCGHKDCVAVEHYIAPGTIVERVIPRVQATLPASAGKVLTLKKNV